VVKKWLTLISSESRFDPNDLRSQPLLEGDSRLSLRSGKPLQHLVEERHPDQRAGAALAMLGATRRPIKASGGCAGRVDKRLFEVRHLVEWNGDRRAGRAGLGFWSDLIIASASTLLALTAHLIDVAIWALVFELCGEFPHLSAAVYHSAANYTSLGDDVLMSAAWRFLGPLETADGMLMFGVSTAMIFAVIQRLVETRFKFDE
jgi:hypothetical protein